MAAESRTLEGSPLVGSRLAFFNGTSLLARELRALLEARSLLVADVKLYDDRDAGAVAEFAGEALVVTAPDEETIMGLDVGFMCGTAAQSEPYLDWAARRGFTAIDLSGAASSRADVPIVHAEINPTTLAGPEGPAPIVAAPHAVAHNLSSLLTAAVEASAAGTAAVRDVHVTALLPASERGEPGIDELYRQTLGLLNFAEVPHEVFERQLAFNVLPLCKEAEPLAARITRETARITGIPEDVFHVAPARVPLFHGHVLSVRLGFDAPVDPTEARRAVAERRGLRLVEDPASFSPVERAGEEGIAVLIATDGRPRTASLSLWSVCDNLKDGAALNAARLAERVVDLRRSPS